MTNQAFDYRPSRERLRKARKRIEKWRRTLPAVPDDEYMRHEVEVYFAFADLRARALSLTTLTNIEQA